MGSYRFLPLMAIFFVLLTAIFMESRSSEAVGTIYVVSGESALLRDYHSPDSGILTRLQHLDQVEYLDTNDYGWWKVRSLRTGLVGWMTSDLLSRLPQAPPPPSPPQPEYFYVNTPCTDLRSIPLHSSAATGTVQLNDRLEKLGTSPKGWTKVRNPRDGSRGWLPTRYLSSHLVSSLPQVYTPKKRVKRAFTGKKKPKVEQKAPDQEKPKPM